MNIEIRNLSKKYFKSHNKALDNVEMVINKGVFGLLGENGAGKITLLKTLATIMPMQEGTITIGDYNLAKDVERIREDIGYLPQRFDFFESLTVYEILDYIASLNNVQESDLELEGVQKLRDSFNKDIENLY